jgi:hypothetical protein
VARIGTAGTPHNPQNPRLTSPSRRVFRNDTAWFASRHSGAASSICCSPMRLRRRFFRSRIADNHATSPRSRVNGECGSGDATADTSAVGSESGGRSAGLTMVKFAWIAFRDVMSSAASLTSYPRRLSRRYRRWSQQSKPVGYRADARSARAELSRVRRGLTRPGGRWVPDGRAGTLAAACRASLRTLGVERIPLYQLHAVDPRVPLSTSVRSRR